MDVTFDIDPDEFHQRKRRRMAAMTNSAPPPKVPPTSAPGVHEVATFLPGRLEFEHELDNEAEELVKDLEFGICLQYGGDQIIEDENDPDVKGRAQMLEERRTELIMSAGSQPFINGINSQVNGHPTPNGDSSQVLSQPKIEEPATDQQANGEEDPNVEEPTQPPPYETEDSLVFKLALIEMYNQRVAKRHEAKAIMYDRGLLEYKKVTLYSSEAFHQMNDVGIRYKPQRRKGQRMRRTLLTGFDRSQDFNPRKITKYSSQIFSVSSWL